jgi:two-component sensor histidine kinase
LVDVKDVISRVVRLVQSNMSRPDQSIKIRVEGDAFRLSSRAATALSLCVNELVQNAMEHAFVGCKSGEIVVSLIDCGGSLEATVQDNGLGKRAGKLNEGSLGLNIVKTLVIEDLRGTFELKRSAKGSAAKITAPISFS